MTVQPTRDQLLDMAEDLRVLGGRPELCDEVVDGLWAALDRAEHRIARLEAQTDIRGRAVVMYRERAREAEAERDEWRQTALDERAAALDLLEQIKARDKRIQAVQGLVDQADHAGDWTVTCSRLQWAIDGTNPTIERQETR